MAGTDPPRLLSAVDIDSRFEDRRRESDAYMVNARGFFHYESTLVFLVVRMLVHERGPGNLFLLASACAALMFATKETAFITLGNAIDRMGGVWIWRRIYRPAVEPIDPEISDAGLRWSDLKTALGDGSHRLLLITPRPCFLST